MKQRTPVFVNILIILTLLIIFYYLFLESWSFLSNPYFWGTVVISVIMALIHNSLGDLIENNRFQKLSETEKAEYLAEKEVPYFTQLYRSAFKQQTSTEEQDLIIDHGFDGIMELDNQLPKWWLGLFWFGVAFCVIYISAFFLTDFAHPIAEYDKEYKEQIASIAEYEKTAPQITLETAVYSPDNIPEGKELFKTNCASCHSANGGGGIGPNLTDDYWINQPEKTLFKNVFHMDWFGSPTNPSMRPMGQNGEISGKEIEIISAFVYHINQELPDVTPAEGGAAPQGNKVVWEE